MSIAVKNVLVTGSNGFIGKNLCEQLGKIENVKILNFNRDTPFNFIEKNIERIDFIFHLAGVSRSNNTEDFYISNCDLIKSIVDLLKKHKRSIPILMTSSIHALTDTDYGKSKKMAEEVLQNYDNAFVYRLSNVFGKWCKPNYCSVVATFCYNISHGLDIVVTNKNNKLQLIYIDDVVEEFIKVFKTGFSSNKKDGFYYVRPVYEVTVDELSKKIEDFKKKISSSDFLKTNDEFTKKLFLTYLSYFN
ncbi:MAG: NAD-dependent epimerase/dehydratase family protein [Candidatus Shapirobacteria bacterium]|nr:NAD-dependent epimerase/dehydratase family protein [Candidatus Shapirobacteria bacterium]